MGLYIAECDRVSVSDDRHISFASSSGKCGGSKTFLGQNADTDEADAVFAVLCKCKQVFGFDRDRFARFQFIDQNMLCAFCVIGFGWTVHGDFGKRNVFTGDAAHQGAECCLGETFLRSEKDFFEAVISVAAAVACDKSTGLGEDNVVACSSDFECQFVYGFKFDHKSILPLVCLNAV